MFIHTHLSRHRLLHCLIALSFSGLPAAFGQAGVPLDATASAPSGEMAQAPLESAAGNVSREAVAASIDRGLAFLVASQDPSGWWSTKDQPGLTSLVLTAFNMAPSDRLARRHASELKKAFDYILTSAQPDGSIHQPPFPALRSGPTAVSGDSGQKQIPSNVKMIKSVLYSGGELCLGACKFTN